MTRLSATGRDLFDQLTARPIYVVDTEFCTHESEHHLISLAVVPIVGGHRVKDSDHPHWVMNPGVPIDAQTSAIHGYTDEHVAGLGEFNDYATVIADLLSAPNALFACHTTIDAHVLRTEFERLDARRAAGETAIKAGLADLPTMPVLDTQRLAYASAYPGVGKNTRISLGDLCALTKVEPPKRATDRATEAHDAREDARATANALIELLKHGAEHRLYYTFEAVLDDANGGTTHSPRGASHITSRPGAGLAVPAAHVARHTDPLIDPVTAGSPQAEAWLELAVECAELRCPYLRDEAVVAAEHNGPVLLPELMKDLPHLTAPGQPATLLGAVLALITTPAAQGATPALTFRQATRWWLEAKKTLKAVAKCNRGDPDECCPSCLEGGPCPRDVMHIAIAEIAIPGKDGELTLKRARHVVDNRKTAPIQAWRVNGNHEDLVAYALWKVAAFFVDQGLDEAANSTLDLAIALNMHTKDPRLTEACGDRLVELGEADKAFKVAAKVLQERTSDPAYADLETWILYTENALYAQQPPPPRPITHPRKARPRGHVNPRLYS